MPDQPTHHTCEIAGCNTKRRSSKAAWCERHYHRWYRHGDPEAPIIRHRAAHARRMDRGYVQVRATGHPLAPKSSDWIYEHRLVLFEAIGPGTHECYWCGRAVTWSDPSPRAWLVVDHLNGDRSHNTIDNLVPACHGCNMGRGGHLDADSRATYLAARRILTRYADEFEDELAALRERLKAQAGPDGRHNAAAIRYAVQTVTR